MDLETAQRVVNGILYAIDQAPELDDTAAGDCAAAIVEGKLFINSPAEFDEALRAVTTAGRLPESSRQLSRRFDEQQLLAFLRAVGAELSRRLADPELAAPPTGMSDSMADGLTSGILIDADRFGDPSAPEAARQCAEEIFTPLRYSYQPAQYVEAIGVVLARGKLGDRTRELSAVADDDLALVFLRALRDELQRRLDAEPAG